MKGGGGGNGGRESEKLSWIHKTQICDDNLKQSTANKLPNFKIANYQEIVCMKLKIRATLVKLGKHINIEPACQIPKYNHNVWAKQKSKVAFFHSHRFSFP